MKLARYGYDVLTISLSIAIAFMIGGIFLHRPVFLSVLLILIGIFFAAFTLYFFRDPDRDLPDEDLSRIVIAPADGKVFLVHDVEEPDYLKGPGKQVAIFLSPLDVHVNRNPISGVIEHKAYHKGQFVPAFKDKSSEINERTHIGVKGEHTKLMMKQIAGTIARRIVCPLEEGEKVTIGERYGMIKFGSRTDIIVPPDVEIMVKPGDRVVGGKTILCRIPERGSSVVSDSN